MPKIPWIEDGRLRIHVERLPSLYAFPLPMPHLCFQTGLAAFRSKYIGLGLSTKAEGASHLDTHMAVLLAMHNENTELTE